MTTVVPTLTHTENSVYDHLCTSCNRARPVTDFYRDIHGEPENRCADCRAEYKKNYYANTPAFRTYVKTSGVARAKSYKKETEPTAVNKGKPYTIKDEEFLRANYRDNSAVDLAKEMGRSYSCITNFAHRLGLRKNVSRPAHDHTRHLTGSANAEAYDNRPWNIDDDIVLYRNQDRRSIHEWSIYLERTENNVESRLIYLNQNPPV